MKVKEIKEIAKKDIFVPDYLIRPLEDKENFGIQNLSDSIKNTGLINEIDVRLLKDGDRERYELMAGGRRLQATIGEKVLAKIYEDVSELDAMIFGITENLQRKDIDLNVRDEYIYRIWKKAKETGDFVYQKDFAKKIGMSKQNLSDIISAGETKDVERNKVDPIIQRATKKDLAETKKLEKFPELRKQLLRYEQESHMDSCTMGNIARIYGNELEKGTSPEIVKIAADNLMNKIDNADSNVGITGTLGVLLNKNIKKVIQENEEITPRRVIEELEIVKNSPPEYQEKLIKKEISIRDYKKSIPEITDPRVSPRLDRKMREELDYVTDICLQNKKIDTRIIRKFKNDILIIECRKYINIAIDHLENQLKEIDEIVLDISDPSAIVSER